MLRECSREMLKSSSLTEQGVGMGRKINETLMPALRPHTQFVNKSLPVYGVNQQGLLVNGQDDGHCTGRNPLLRVFGIEKRAARPHSDQLKKARWKGFLTRYDTEKPRRQGRAQRFSEYLQKSLGIHFVLGTQRKERVGAFMHRGRCPEFCPEGNVERIYGAPVREERREVEGVSKAVSLKRKFADQYVHEVLTRQVRAAWGWRSQDLS